MSPPIDEQVAAAVRAAIGFPAGAAPDDLDLATAAAVVQAADGPAAMDGGSVILTAVRLIWETKMHGGTAEAARAAARAIQLNPTIILYSRSCARPRLHHLRGDIHPAS